MNKLIRHLPNTLTICNLASGTLGIIMVFRKDYFAGAYFIWAGAAFDFLDGLAARLLKAYSDLGRELDSLADMITFGVLPAMVLFGFISGSMAGPAFLPYACLLPVIFSALRLARFNIDAGQKEHFRGLPTPASAFLLSGLPFISSVPALSFAGTPAFVIAVIVITSGLMVSPFSFISLKMNHPGIARNGPAYLTVLAAVILLLTFRKAGVSMAIVAYIVISLLNNRKKAAFGDREIHP